MPIQEHENEDGIYFSFNTAKELRDLIDGLLADSLEEDAEVWPVDGGPRFRIAFHDDKKLVLFLEQEEA